MGDGVVDMVEVVWWGWGELIERIFSLVGCFW
jgi:hypothetical protein